MVGWVSPTCQTLVRQAPGDSERLGEADIFYVITKVIKVGHNLKCDKYLR